ncbi:hypothetical protein EVG20_g10012 [Dentipellis fragilis]|uniref:DUF6593 domain-containing protein n=1 Tax=Dentipellis fragilis TaxID=205917 RepID=A0A4Y9XWD9_9AGAM|nr:hypothetical protein EVG20_g10012 [Dentipellis fragilis]
MNLHVSRSSILNTVLRDDSGEPRYRIETSTTNPLRDQETTVSRFLPGPTTSGSEEQSHPRSTNTDDETDILMRGLPEEEIARIEWHQVKSTVFKWSGQNPVDVSTYMPYTGLLMRKRAFTATDGQSYAWKYGSTRSSLSRNDSSSARIAQYHKRSYGIIGKTHKAYLEISPEGLNIADEIVVTFVYIERRRDQREEAARA